MSLLLLVIAFVLTGVGNISNKALGEMGLSAYRDLYALGFWGMGALLGLIQFAVSRHRMHREDAVIGILMGASGAVMLLAFITSLNTIPGVVAFPGRSCGNIALTAIASYALWRERISITQRLGIACAVVCIYLLV